MTFELNFQLGWESILDEDCVPMHCLIECIAVLLHETMKQDVVSAQVGVLIVEDGDVNLWPRERLDDQPLGPLHVQAEVVHLGIAQGQ